MSRAKKLVSLFVSAAIAVPLFAQEAEVAKGHEPSMLVVQAKQKLVQIAFDMALMRDVTLVSFDKNAKTGKITLHVWDNDIKQWVNTNLDEVKAGAGAKQAIKNSIIVGVDAGALTTLAGSTPGDVKTVVSTDLVNLMNALNDVYLFNPNEWKWLAKRHDLELKDLNEDRRRYGRYGKPGEVPLPTPETDLPKVTPQPVVTPTPVPAPEVPTPVPAPVVSDRKPTKPAKPSVDLAPVKPEDK